MIDYKVRQCSNAADNTGYKRSIGAVMFFIFFINCLPDAYILMMLRKEV